MRALAHPVALALHLDELGVGEEAVEDGGGGGACRRGRRPSPGWVGWW